MGKAQPDPRYLRPAGEGPRAPWNYPDDLPYGKKSQFGRFIGEAWTRAKLKLQGYRIVAEEPEMTIDTEYGPKTIKPDFLAIDDNRRLVAVDSKFGLGAKFEDNQLAVNPLVVGDGIRLDARTAAVWSRRRVWRVGSSC
ncbi:hypothetical protein [Nocardia sp. R6R-6]|uniref:hypothetical protein n=1 Tax=Nocardia sp. R6R-6 TaxID=3459303 RepID=UPI00403DBA7F